MKHLSILGSTGSIGRAALSVVAQFPDRFSVKALAAKSNVSLLADQIGHFNPEIAVVFDEKTAMQLKRLLPAEMDVHIGYGDEGYRLAATLNSVDMVLAAVVGAAGLLPTLAAIDAGKDIALANKETLVMAGAIVTRRAAENGVKILPVDSEHSAIFQCLSGNRKKDLLKILLTASGGPFLHRPRREFAEITPDEALDHPNWQMGKKITIDSATMMNKGLEVLEAKWLFDVSHTMIEVVIHPQSIVHSMVAYRDGSVMAQLGIPDMKGAIAYALSHPDRLPLQQPLPDLAAIGSLGFQKPDFDQFPCLALAYQAADKGGSLPAVMNAANEVAVMAFLEQKISYTQIAELIRQTMKDHKNVTDPDLAEILAADRWARRQAEKIASRLQA
ncbi:MAG: 1-deoxy-D-xylulose-5-phosphate reductoisomerase [Desulfobacterales bacterium]|jgi:1-deoxy-D-xylulose-5-phosphate reductoisomerase